MGKNKRRNKQQGQGASEEQLIAVRRAKAARVRERGQNPFANDVQDDTLSAAEADSLQRLHME